MSRSASMCNLAISRKVADSLYFLSAPALASIPHRLRFEPALDVLDPQRLDVHLGASHRAGLPLDPLRRDLLGLAGGAGAGQGGLGLPLRREGCGPRPGSACACARSAPCSPPSIRRVSASFSARMRSISPLAGGVRDAAHGLRVVLRLLALRGHLQAMGLSLLQRAGLRGQRDLAVPLLLLAGEIAPDVRLLALPAPWR